MSFRQFFCELQVRLVLETMLKNIRCFIVFIVILVLGSFRKQGIVFSFFTLEYEAEKIKYCKLHCTILSNQTSFPFMYIFFNSRLIYQNNFLLSNRGETGSHLASLWLLGGE